MSDKVIMVYTVNDSSAFVFNQTLDNMKVIGKWQDNPDQLFKLGTTVFNGVMLWRLKSQNVGHLVQYQNNKGEIMRARLPPKSVVLTNL
ncbi:hypothetical protein LLUC023_12145 [Lactococcus cremoris]|uniref:hypothetical protein n=1 Tax=Lactococcus lactis subsp. cremoris TaxID=1359 RepID=UPI0024A6F31C|nr:hypothetical protein [Lactococcus cremoris]